MDTSSWTSFRSGLHGFHFQNDFSDRKYKLPGVGSFSLAGLCGGMCFAALDYAYQRKPIPAIKETPLEGPLFDHLLSCQLRTLNVGLPGDEVLQKTFEWMNSPNVPHHLFSPHSLRHRTRQEWPVIKSFLDSRHPITLMLIRARGVELTNNHQVLAYQYQRDADGVVTLKVYDPNLPCRDDVTIQSHPVSLGEANSSSGTQAVLGLQSIQKVGGESYRMVRGFFAMPYIPVKPPAWI